MNEKSDTAKREEETIKFWKDNNIFEKSLKKESPKGEFVFYDGPPFATGLPHYGSLLSSIVKDVFGRYKTMQGYHVRRRWGWDCHGLPIESMIEKELNLKTKKDIEELGVEKFNEAARNSVLRLADEWEWYIDRVGRWVEFSNSYKTMDNSYIESVWWALKTIHEKGLLYEGRKVLLYCPRCETPLAKAEIAQDNSYRDITEEAVTVKFKVKDPEKHNLPANTYLLAWTTTPWTLPGNVALAIHKDIKYVLVQNGEENLILANELLENNFDVEVSFEEIKSKDLIGIGYEPLFEIKAINESQKKAHYVVDADFVTTEEGTGIVHTAVMYGEDDYTLGQKVDLPMIPLLDASGHFSDFAPKLIQGKYFKDSEEVIKDYLEKNNLLFKKENHTHSYPHCYRCGTQLLYNAISSWFINLQKIKDKIIKKNEDISWHPEHLKHGRFLNILEGAPDWTISRNRYWASPLPIWKCEECSEVSVIGSVEELKEKSKSEIPEDLHRPYIDSVTIDCGCGGTMKRIPEVVDCWIESGSMPFAERHYPFDNKKEFEKNFPSDFIAEYIGQVRTWFYYMHVMAVLLFDKVSYKNVVVTGNIQGADGRKMSKSLGNYTDPKENFDLYGSDALRLYAMGSPVMQSEDINFLDEDLREVYNRTINILWNSYKFYDLYKDQYDGKTDFSKSTNVLDKWIIEMTNKLNHEAMTSLDNYNTVKASRAIKSFVTDFSTWYIRRSRDRFKDKGSEDQQYALATTKFVLERISRIIAPIIPFIADEIYRGINGEKESVHLSTYPEESVAKQDVLEKMQKVRDIVSLALEARSSAKLKVRQPLAKLIVKGEPMDDSLIELMKDEVNVKEVLFDESQDEAVVLDIQITPELRKEGMVRELIRHIQNERKNKGLTPQDMATLKIDGDQSMIEEFRDQIMKVALLREIVFEKGETEVKVEDKTFYISIEK